MRLEADIAGVRVAIDAPPSWIDGPVTERFGRFAAPRAAADPALVVRLVEHARSGACPAESWSGARAFFAAAAAGAVPDYPLEIGRDGNRLAIEGPFMSGAVDLERGRGMGIACDRGALGSLENFLRVGVAHLLLPRGG
ncbi:MAG TPA: hypothetical protein VMV18_09525, partial [bacterium]|nr:hypothetical protein [bacterium]